MNQGTKPKTRYILGVQVVLNLFFSVVSGSEVPSLVDSDERKKIIHSSCYRIEHCVSIVSYHCLFYNIFST